jgi:hypothetical protein
LDATSQGAQAATDALARDRGTYLQASGELAVVEVFEHACPHRLALVWG